MGPPGPKHYIFGNQFYSRMQESIDSMYFFILMLENIWYYQFTWSGPSSPEIVNLFQFSSVSWRPTIGTKFPISSEFGPL